MKPVKFIDDILAFYNIIANLPTTDTMEKIYKLRSNIEILKKVVTCTWFIGALVA